MFTIISLEQVSYARPLADMLQVAGNVPKVKQKKEPNHLSGRPTLDLNVSRARNKKKFLNVS